MSSARFWRTIPTASSSSRRGRAMVTPHSYWHQRFALLQQTGKRRDL